MPAVTRIERFKAKLKGPRLRGLVLFARFGIVGVINAAFGYLVFAALLLVGVWPGLALALAAAAGSAFTFQTSRRLVFRSPGHVIRFIVVYAAILAINWVAIALLHGGGLSHLEAQAWLTAPVAVLSFVCQRNLVFGAGSEVFGEAAPRRNLMETPTEKFKPPIFKPNLSRISRLENRLRRFLDLQAGTIWRDLRRELRYVRGSLLDIGCGAQLYRPLVPRGVVYCGLDTIDAKERFGYRVPDTQYFAGSDWGVADGAFDVALCTEVLEHISDPAAFLARSYRCLRPGGRLVMTTPFAARWHFIPYDYWRFTPSGLGLLLGEAGFEGIRIEARGNPLTVACYKAMTIHLLLLFGAGRNPVARAAGILFLPSLGILACIANLSLLADWGDDCLGYTITASKPPAQALLGNT